MRHYSQIKSFIKAVEEKDIQDVKEELIDFILFFEGNKEEIYTAVNYAKENGAFEFEENEEVKFHNEDENLSGKSLFIREKIKLTDINFSKERFDTLIDIYNDINRSENTPQSHHENSLDTYENHNQYEDEEYEDNDMIKKVLIAVGVAIGGYILYKIIS